MENKKPTKRQHFVPRFLLENFTGRDGKLVQYAFKYKYYSHKFPSQICYREFLYETKFDGRDKKEGNMDFVYINRIENYFKTKEDAYAPCIRTVLDICSNPKNTNSLVCSTAHKEILASFSANILLRNPVIMNTAELGVKDSKLWQSNNVKIIIDILKYLGIDNIDSIALAAKKDAWFDETLDNSAQSIIKRHIIQNMSFNFLVSNNAHFIVTDFPFSYHVNSAKNKINVLNVPISSNCLLALVNKKIDKRNDNRISYVDDDMVIFCNELMIKSNKNDLEYIYAKDQKDIEEILHKIGDNNDQT